MPIFYKISQKDINNCYASILSDFPPKYKRRTNYLCLFSSSGFPPNHFPRWRTNWGSKKLTNFISLVKEKSLIIFSLPYTLLSCPPWDLCLFTQKPALIKQKTFMMKPFIWPYLFYDLVKPNVKWNLLQLHFWIHNVATFAFSSLFHFDEAIGKF